MLAIAKDFIFMAEFEGIFGSLFILTLSRAVEELYDTNLKKITRKFEISSSSLRRYEKYKYVRGRPHIT
jgi:hypothetical protein